MAHVHPPFSENPCMILFNTSLPGIQAASSFRMIASPKLARMSAGTIRMGKDFKLQACPKDTWLHRIAIHNTITQVTAIATRPRGPPSWDEVNRSATILRTAVIAEKITSRSRTRAIPSTGFEVPVETGSIGGGFDDEGSDDTGFDVASSGDAGFGDVPSKGWSRGFIKIHPPCFLFFLLRTGEHLGTPYHSTTLTLDRQAEIRLPGPS